MEPIRNFLRHKKAVVKYYEAEATKIDYDKKIVYINDDSPIKGDTSATEVSYDMLVVGVGAENATFGMVDSCEPSTQPALMVRLQESRAFANTRAFSRRWATPRQSASASWTAARRPRSRGSQCPRSSASCTWLSSVAGPPASSLRASCRTSSRRT